MPTKTITSTPIPPPDGTPYRPDTGYREWVRFKRPYTWKIGDFVTYRRLQRSGLRQDSYWAANSNTGKAWVVNGFVPPSFPSPDSDAVFSAYARNQAIYKLQDQISKSDFNLAVSGAEATKTVELITHTAARLLKAALALKKGRLGDAYGALGLKPRTQRLPKPKKVRENAGNYWLEMQYGWKPLLSDIDGGCKALAELLNEPSTPIFYADARSAMKDTGSIRFVQGSGTFAVDTTWDYVTKKACRVGCAYRIRSGEIVRAARLGLTNPALVVWEVVPFSFVVDWFAPVGNFLSQLSAYHGLEFVSGYQTQFYKATLLNRKDNRYPNGVRLTGDASLIRDMRQRRTKLSSFPYAGILLKDPLSVSHGVTTLALLQNVLGVFGKQKGLRT